MDMNATEFRKNIFDSLERVREGETLEIMYKGTAIKISAVTGSKLARAKRQHTLLVDPLSIVSTDPELMEEMEKTWEEDWKEI